MTKPKPILPEIFSHRIELEGGGHADVGLSEDEFADSKGLKLTDPPRTHGPVEDEEDENEDESIWPSEPLRG